jgi:hypothetical protein
VLVEYLIPLENNAIAQSEHVFFDIDVKGGIIGVLWMLQLEI